MDKLPSYLEVFSVFHLIIAVQTNLIHIRNYLFSRVVRIDLPFVLSVFNCLSVSFMGHRKIEAWGLGTPQVGEEILQF